MEKIETAEKVTTVVVKGKDMSPEELKNNLLNLVDGYEDAEKVVKMTVGYVEEKSTNADNYEEKGASVINFTDLGRSLVDASKLVSVAVNEKTGKTTIALGGNEDGKPEIVVKEEGKHLLSFFTEIGDKYTQELSVVAGKLYELMGEMNEKAIRDSASKAQVQNSSASGLFNKSSDSKGESSTSGKSSSSMASPFTRSSSSFAANTDSKSIVGKWKVVSQSIDHEITDMEACYAIFGDEEDNSFAEEECVDKEVPVDYSIGEQLLFYSDGTADHINKKGDNDGSYDYSFDKMTSSFAYTDDDGNLAMAQVSTDGETLSVQVVSELPYMRITYKLVLKKVSDDIE